MNAIQHALNELKHRIPKDILKEAFEAPLTRNDGWSRMHAPVVNIDHIIREKVIESRVVPSLNLISGQRDYIPLDGLVREYQNDFTQVITIPKDRTRGLSITAVFAIVSGSALASTTGYANTLPQRSNGVVEALAAMRSSRMPVPVVSDMHIRLISDNTVLLTAPLRQYGFLFLDCMLENDRMFSHIPPAAWRDFAKIVEYAVKAYIYNEVVIPIDQAQLSGGMSIGRFREIVDGYSDANDLYDEKVKDWQVINVLADPHSFEEHIIGVVGGLFP